MVQLLIGVSWAKKSDEEGAKVKTPVEIIRVLTEPPELTFAEVTTAIGKSTSAVERASSKRVK